MDRAEILELYALEGRSPPLCGGMSRVQHAWQCARLARNAGAAPSLQLAAWLHEVGELRMALSGSATKSAGEGDVADPSQQSARWLEPLFGPTVARPVALQEAAYRCLASTKPDFRRRMPNEWQARIEQEGGPQTLLEARAFLQRPFAPQAIRLCLWDAEAQDPHLRPPSLEGALDALRRLMWLLQTSPPLRAATLVPRACAGRRLTTLTAGA